MLEKKARDDKIRRLQHDQRKLADKYKEEQKGKRLDKEELNYLFKAKVPKINKVV